MGVTLHIAKPSLTFKAEFNGEMINISVAPFAAMANDYKREWWTEKKSDTTKSCDRKFDAVDRAKAKGWKPEYVILTWNAEKPDSHCYSVYKVSEHSNGYHDCEMGSNSKPHIGTLVKFDGKYRVIPKDEKIHLWIMKHYPSYYQDYNSKHGVWQRINKTYKATVNCIGDLERYIYGNPEMVDLDLFRCTAPEQRNAPNWMIEGIESLKKQFYNHYRDVEPDKRRALEIEGVQITW